MRQQLLRTFMACAAGLALGAQAQSSASGGVSTDPSSTGSGSSSPYPSSSSTSPSSQESSSSSSQSGWSGRHLSATGRMGHEALRGSQLTGAQVSNSSGSQIGTISDFIVNPSSGRLEFGVIALNGGSSGSSTSTSSSATSATASGKQVAVPWMLLRPSSSGSSSSAAGSTSTSAQPSFTFAGDSSKLDSAPTFDTSTDLNQPSWRQSVFSYFGLSGTSSATGGAFSPGGSSTGTGTSGSDLSTGSSSTSGTSGSSSSSTDTSGSTSGSTTSPK